CPTKTAASLLHDPFEEPHMKKLLIAFAALVCLPKAHACTVTVTPSTFTLQTSHKQLFTAARSSCANGQSWSWNLSCSPSGNCGGTTSLSATSIVYTAPSSLVSNTVESVTVTATYGTTSGSASVAVNAVQINALQMPSGAPSGDVSAFQTYVLGSN